jgi:type IV secretory pathway VirB3-like protein
MEELDSSEIKKSLLSQLTTLGVDDWLFVMNLCTAILVSVILRFPRFLILSLLMHFVLMVVTQLSPQLLEKYLKHMRQSDRYTPWPMATQKRGLRPLGYGRGVQI